MAALAAVAQKWRRVILRASLMEIRNCSWITRNLPSRQLAGSSVIGGGIVSPGFGKSTMQRAAMVSTESHAGRTSHVDQARHSEKRYREFPDLIRSGISFRPVLSE